MIDIVLLILLMAGAIAIPFWLERKQSRARAGVGPGAVSLHTMKSGTRFAVRSTALTGLVLSLLIVGSTVWRAFHGEIDPGIVFEAVVNSAELFFGCAIGFYILWNYGRFHVGPNGISEQRLARKTHGANSDGMVPWERIKRLEWDRDIGQRSWGLNFHYLDRKARTYSIRMYVPRDSKPELQALFDQYLPAGLRPEQPARYTNGIHRSAGADSSGAPRNDEDSPSDNTRINP